MPSFDIVSKADVQEVDNALNSMKREIENRYDFKGSASSIERKEQEIELIADDNVKHKAMVEMLKAYLTRRKLDPKILDFGKVEQASGNKIRQTIKIRNGIESEVAKQINKEIKGSKIKVQVETRGDEVRVTGKKRDELQQVIQLVKELNLETPLQFVNYRE